MVKHNFVCDDCDVTISVTNTKKVHRCPKCNAKMRWDILFNCGSGGDFCHVSQSLGIMPSQKREHEKMFPDVKVHDDGRLEFNDIKKYDDYMDKTGFYKKKGKQKRKPHKSNS